MKIQVTVDGNGLYHSVWSCQRKSGRMAFMYSRAEGASSTIKSLCPVRTRLNASMTRCTCSVSVDGGSNQTTQFNEGTTIYSYEIVARNEFFGLMPANIIHASCKV